MTNKEYIELLKKCPEDAEVWMPVFNGHTTTYGIVDYAFEFEYDDIINDLFGTPGRTDKRLFSNRKERKSDKIVLVSSKFGEYRNDEVDFGDDDINYDIRTINGEGGDEDLVWHLNGFKWFPDIECFIKQEYEDDKLVYEITYHKSTTNLSVVNLKDEISAQGKLVGIEDIRDMIKVCKIPMTLMC